MLSKNKKYKAVLESINFKIYNTLTGNSIWSSNLLGSYPLPYRLIMQTNRDCAIFDPNYRVLWASNTGTSVLNFNNILTLEDDGSLKISNNAGYNASATSNSSAY